MFGGLRKKSNKNQKYSKLNIIFSNSCQRYSLHNTKKCVIIMICDNWSLDGLPPPSQMGAYA